MFNYKGYSYEADEDNFEDNKKIIHLVTDKNGKKIQLDFSPYSVMNENTFKNIIDLSIPSRKKDMLIPWNHDTIKKEFSKEK